MDGGKSTTFIIVFLLLVIIIRVYLCPCISICAVFITV
jgi:hypothetical protein